MITTPRQQPTPSPSTRSLGPEPDPAGPVAGSARIVALAVAAALLQAYGFDASPVWPLRQVDLPLTLAAVLVVAVPARSAVVGLVFGLAVDATTHRLFGLHCLAYAALGPVAGRVPVPGAIRSLGAGATHRRGAAETAWLVAAQVGAASVVVIAGRSVAAGGLVPLGRLVPTVVAAALLAPLLLIWPVGGARRRRIGVRGRRLDGRRR